MLDFKSLLVAIAFSVTCLAATLIAAWTTSRTDGFLLTCALGAVLVGVGAAASAIYVTWPGVALGILAFAFMLAGLATLYGTARQFRNSASPWRAIVIAGLVASGATLPLHAAGYNGIGFVVGYLASATLLALTAHQYWIARAESPGIVTAIAAFYLVIALSFLPRATIVLLDGKAVIPGQPSNWAEDLSLVLVVAAVPAIGAMTMALNQRRLVRGHRLQAMTDPLTGLLNRRALFEAFEGDLNEPMMAAVFDIDRFKSINDTHGHAAGDRIIATFARALRMEQEPNRWRARLGGEEFALISPYRTVEEAMIEVEQIRARFTALALEEEGLHCTASAGLAFSDARIDDLGALLNAADQALYEAKHGGRNRAVLADI